MFVPRGSNPVPLRLEVDHPLATTLLPLHGDQPPLSLNISAVFGVPRQGLIDVEKEVAKLSTKKGELEKQMDKLKEKMAKNDYKEKVPVKVQEQDAEKVREEEMRNVS